MRRHHMQPFGLKGNTPARVLHPCSRHPDKYNGVFRRYLAPVLMVPAMGKVHPRFWFSGPVDAHRRRWSTLWAVPGSCLPTALQLHMVASGIQTNIGGTDMSHCQLCISCLRRIAATLDHIGATVGSGSVISSISGFRSSVAGINIAGLP